MPAAAANMLDRNIRVQYYSDDVTVRYFLPKLVVALPFDSEWKPRAVTEPQGRVIDFD